MGILDRVKNDGDLESVKTISSLDIFASLTHQEGYGYLRSNQKDFLVAWERIRSQRDVVGILNTGAGKTLVGLLMLLSKMNEGVGPSMYLCPDNQLVEQVMKQAKLHNIPVVSFGQGDSRNILPIDFLNGKAILITTFEKLFNGRSIFGVAGYGIREIEDMGSILIDDAHSCIRKARSQTTLRIERQSPYYEQFFNLFKSELENQGRGQFLAVKNGEYSVSKMIPYWSWKDNLSTIKKIINEMYINEASEIIFPHNLIIDYLDSCQCYISGNGIEVTPWRIPLEKIPAYSNAKHRFVLSATFSNNSDLISELGIAKESVQHPIEIRNISDVGERMILAPSKYHTGINIDLIGEVLKGYSEKANVVILTPSKFKAKKWEACGARIIQSNIDSEIDNLYKTKGNFVVFVNRYDGIDLSGDSCHFLVIDGISKGETIKEKANSIMRPNSNYLISQKAQTIEQGLGRAVRSGSDFCVVFLMGEDLLQFVAKNKNLKYFSAQTQSQLDLTQDLIQDVKSNSTLEEAWDEVRTAVNLCLTRDADWIKMYKGRLKKASEEEQEDTDKMNQLLDIAERELSGLEFYSKKDFQSAYDSINSILNDKLLNDNQETGWYYQILGEIMYNFDQTRSNELQISAKNHNDNLLTPIHPVREKKRKPSSSQAKNSCNWIQEFTSNMDLLHFIRTNVSALNYSQDTDHKAFEKAVFNLGFLLGFESTTPEKTLDDGGPDNLWRSPEYSLIIECKNEVVNGIVAKQDLGQLLETLDWYEARYISSNDYSGIFFHPYNKLDRRASYSDKIRVVTADKLDLLKDKIEIFGNRLGNKNLSDWSPTEIDDLLNQLNFNIGSFKSSYTVELIE